MNDHSRRCSRGQVLVYVAIGMVGLMGCLALAADVAVFYFNWAQLRKEVDASALAGASYLPSFPSKASDTATQYVTTNGLAGDQIVENAIGNLGINGLPDSSITVSVRRVVPYYFGRVVGLTNAPVTVTAVAAIQPISASSRWIPIAMPCTGSSCYAPGCSPQNADGTGCYSCGRTATLNVNQLVPGDWGPVNCGDGNNGTPTYVDGIINGCATEVSVGDKLYSKPGNAVQTEQAINARLARCPSCQNDPPAEACSGGNIDPSDPHVVLLPLLDTSQWSSGRSSPATLYGFALGWIVSAKGNNVTIEFISQNSGTSGTPDPNGPLSGPFAPVLIR